MSRFASRLVSVIGCTGLVVLGIDYVSMASTGQSLILGRANSAGSTTTVTNTGAGPALSLTVGSASRAPLATNGRGKVANLYADRAANADRLGGQTLAQAKVGGNAGKLQGLTANEVSVKGIYWGRVSFDNGGNPVYLAPDVTITNPYIGVWCIKPDGLAANAAEDAQIVATPDYSNNGTGYDSGTGYTYLAHVEVRSSGKDCPAGTFEVLTSEITLDTSTYNDVQAGFAFTVMGFPGSTAAAPLGAAAVPPVPSGRDSRPTTGTAARQPRPASGGMR